MRRTASVFGVIATLASSSATLAQGRPLTSTLTCSAVQAVVARDQDVVLATSENAYEMVHASSMACSADESGVPAFEPTVDDQHCLAGWRCKQRNTGDTGR